MRRALPLVLLAACAPASSPAPAATVRAPALSAPQPSYIPASTAKVVADAWRAHLARTADAEATLARALRAVGAPGATDGIKPRGLLVDGGASAVVRWRHQLVIADAMSGSVKGVLETNELDSLEPLEGTALLAGLDRSASDGPPVGGVVFDVRSARRVARFDHATALEIADEGRALVVADGAGWLAGAPPPSIVVWSVPEARELRRIAVPGYTEIYSLSVFDRGRVVMPFDDHGPVRPAFEIASGKELLRQPGGYAIGTPAFTPDGRLVAHVRSRGDGDRGSVVVLDRSSGATLGESKAVGRPRHLDLSSNGKLLAIGDLAMSWLLELPSMRVVARGPSTTGGEPPDWDPELHEVKVQFVAGDRALVAHPAIGDTVVLAVPSLRVLWRGDAEELSFAKDGTASFIERSRSTGKATRVSVIAGPKLVRAPYEEQNDYENSPHVDDPIADLPHALVERLARSVCRVGDWLLPPAACAAR